MLLQVPQVLNVGASAQPSRGIGLSFDGEGAQPKVLRPTGVHYRPLCPWPKP